jgi:hypothetical protein
VSRSEEMREPPFLTYGFVICILMENLLLKCITIDTEYFKVVLIILRLTFFSKDTQLQRSFLYLFHYLKTISWHFLKEKDRKGNNTHVCVQLTKHHAECSISSASELFQNY